VNFSKIKTDLKLPDSRAFTFVPVRHKHVPEAGLSPLTSPSDDVTSKHRTTNIDNILAYVF